MRLLKKEKKALVSIFLLYVMTQGLILFVSGRWFDDWCLVNISNQGLIQWSLETGRPSIFPISALVRDFPRIYKVGIFLAYYMVAVCFYLLIRKIFKMDLNDALMVCFIYLCLPINDVRIIRSAMPYTIGLMLWFLAFCILVYKYDNLNFFLRLLTLLLFFVSFILNSLLVFYGLVLLYIIIMERRSLKKILFKIDFFIIPFAFFLCKQFFFPAHGVYSSYNEVSISSIFSAVKVTFYAFFIIFKDILLALIETMRRFNVMLGTLVFALIVSIGIKYFTVADSSEKGKNTDRFIAIEFLVGFLTILAGIYPYAVVVPHSRVFTAVGFNGRFSMLVPFGWAIIIDAILKFSCKREGRIAIMVGLMIAGTIHFTKWYSVYQSNYYWERGLQVCLSENSNLENVKTVYFEGTGMINTGTNASWYELNGVFEEVFGNENRLVVGSSELENVHNFVDQSVIEREWYNMTGYDGNYNEIDVVILYSNTINLREGMRLRLLEIIGQDIESELIEKASFKVIFPEDKEFSSYVTF